MGIDEQIKRTQKRIDRLQKEGELRELKSEERMLEIKSTRKYRAGRAIGRGGLAIGRGIKKYAEWRAAPVKRRKKKQRASIFDFDF